MRYTTPNPARRPLFWTDGTTSVPLDPATEAAWLERGVSRGWVVTARDAEQALSFGAYLARLTRELGKPLFQDKSLDERSEALTKNS